jgi:hypothetical protein
MLTYSEIFRVPAPVFRVVGTVFVLSLSNSLIYYLIPFSQKNLSSPKGRCFSQGVIMRKGGIFETLQAALIVASLSFFGCDLLNNKPEIDLEKAIDDTVAYANAARLTVTLAIPDGWGASNTPVSTIDIRKGHGFNLEFSPSAAYSFAGWRAYRTAVLAGVPNWRDAPADMLEGVTPVPQVEAGAFSAVSIGENKHTLTINIRDPVTLVPWCEDEPRVIRTDPVNNAQTFNHSRSIIIYFAAELNPDTVGLGPGKITIQGRSIADEANSDQNTDYSAHFSLASPPYDSYTRSITINSSGADILTDKIITVTVGEGIKSGLSGTRGMSKAYTFSYRIITPPSDVTTTWDAAYSGGGITGSHTHSLGTGGSQTAAYSVDGGVRQPLALDGDGNFSIPNVPAITDSGVRNGEAVANVHEYQISFYVSSGSEVVKADTIKIWNIPGMSVSNTAPAEEISTQAELAAMATGNAGKKYVLANDITLSGTWMPIGTDTDPFLGTFYGNGHAITVGSGFDNVACTGIFGYTGGSAVIRDLAVAYNADVTADSSATDIGGIVGRAGGTTAIRNCVVSGADSATLSKTGASVETYLGGMAGYMEPGAVIVNGSSNLNVHLGIDEYKGSAGGAVGYIAGDSSVSITNISGVSASGNVSLDTTSNYRMNVGGVVGASESSGWIEDVSFAGTVSASRDAAERPPGTSDPAMANSIGGIVGSAAGTSFDSCVFTGTVKTPIDGGSFGTAGGVGYETRVGGIVGYYTTGGVLRPRMRNSTASGMFSIIHNGSGTLFLGGVVGLADNKKDDQSEETENKITIENCRYERGTIILERNQLLFSRYDLIGGFAGKLDPCDITDCESLAGLIRVTGRSPDYAGSLWAGGFVSEIRTGSNVTNCYSASPVEAHNYSSAGRTDHRGMAVGGFAALIQFEGIVTNCYASGNVTAYAASDRLAAGGFAGRADRFDVTAGNKIQFCYAAGDVHAISDRPTASTNPTWIDFAGGGFAGISIGTAISDCYALGDVLAEGGSAAVPVYAGGFSGYLADAINPSHTPATNPGSIETCFAAGSVRAQSAEAARVYAGGVAGYAASGTLRNNAARGALIQAKSDNATNRKAGRVYGEKSSTPPTINSNYGLKTMTTGTGGYYDTVSPSIPSSNIGPADMNGADVAHDTKTSTTPPGIRTENFWKNTLGFSAADWNFSDVAYRGYPVLK